MAELRRLFIAVLLMATFVPPGVRGQLRESTHVPDRFEFFEGHAYMGRDSVKWEYDKLVFVKRVADMSGKGSFAESTEQLSPHSGGLAAILGAHRLARRLAMESRLQRSETRWAGWGVLGFDAASRDKAAEIERL